MFKNIGVWVGLLIAAFGASLFVMSLSLRYYGQYGPGPGLFPLWMSGVLIVLSVFYIISSIDKESLHFKNVIPERKIINKLLIILGSIFLFIIISPYCGYVLSSIVVLMCLLWRSYKWYVSLSISFAVTIVLYMVFGMMLKIPLPVGVVGF